MAIRTRLANFAVRWLGGLGGRLVDPPRPSQGWIKSAANTPANNATLSRKVTELETYWSGVFKSWGVAELLTASKMLSVGRDPGLDVAFLRPATAVLMLREVQRRWETETYNAIRAAVLAEAGVVDAHDRGVNAPCL